MISKISKVDGLLNKVLSIVFGKRVRMALEISYFNNYRSWSEGIDFGRFTFECNHSGDHTPLINLFIGVFNFKLIELGVYNTFHEDDEDEDLDCPYKVEPNV